MFFILSRVKGLKQKSFIVWNTGDKTVKIHDEGYIFKNITLYNGVRLRDNIIDTSIGYKNIPTVVIDNNTTILYDNKEYCTLVGKFIEHKQKFYLIVYGNGFKRKVTEGTMLQLIKEQKVTNVMNSTNLIKLRVGSLPIYTTSHRRAILDDTVEKVVDCAFNQVVGSPGIAQKFVGRLKETGEVGIVKRTLSTNMYDNINEVLCYDLGRLLGVNVCRAKQVIYKGAKEWVLSVFSYNFPNECFNFASAKQLFGVDNFEKNFTIAKLGEKFGENVVKDFQRMLLFDLITRQTDRHISNFAFFSKNFYPLYDNGRCLFWDSADVTKINDDIFSTFITNEHGYGYAYVDDLGCKYCSTLINNSLTYKDFLQLFYKHYGKTERALELAKYVFTVYNLVIGGVVDV